MLTYEKLQYSDRVDGRVAAINGAANADRTRFALVTAAITIALFVVQHDLKFASFALADAELQGDLVAEVGSSHASRQVSFLGLAALGVALLVSYTPARLRLDWRILAFLIALCAWIALSAFWADDVALSLKRTMPPLFTVLAACGLAKSWTPRQVMLFTAVMTSTFLLVAVAAECATGAFLHTGNYQFAGTLHPNDQAVNCAMLCLASLCLYRDEAAGQTNRANRAWLFLAAVALGFLVLTGSRTATLACAAALLTFWTMGAAGYQKLLVRAGIVMVAAGVGVMLLEADSDSNHLFANVATMGRNQDEQDMASLTGRIPIWRHVLQDVAAAPVTGYGYGGFWTPERVLDYSYILGWEFTHAHSAYFETLLNVGGVGLCLGLFIVLMARQSALREFKATHDSGCRFVAVVLTMALVHGLFDSNFVRDGLAPTISLLCIATMAFHHGGQDAT